MVKKRFMILCSLFGASVCAQSNTGELRLQVSDPANLGVRATVELICETNQFHEGYSTDESGKLIAKRLPFGVSY